MLIILPLLSEGPPPPLRDKRLLSPHVLLKPPEDRLEVLKEHYRPLTQEKKLHK